MSAALSSRPSLIRWLHGVKLSARFEVAQNHAAIQQRARRESNPRPSDSKCSQEASTAVFNPSQTVSIATSDFNRDGFKDVAIVTPTGAAVVLLGNGDGTFRREELYGGGADAQSIAVADFDEDGIPDLIVADRGSNAVSVLLGAAGGAFDGAFTLMSSDHTVPWSLAGLATADLNGDGRPDLLVADFGAGVVRIFYSYPVRRFNPDFPIFVLGSPTSVAVGDLNQDHRLDIVAVSPTTNEISVMLGTFFGWGSPTRYAAGIGPGSVALTDVNQDGFLDLVVANLFSNNVSILLGNGDGTFQRASPYPVGMRPGFVVVGDFNGDGAPDLVTANSGSNTITVLINRDGTFANRTDYAVDNHPVAVAIGDLNGDGVLDLAVVSADSNSISILLGSADGTFGPALRFESPGRPDGIVLSDFNRDGFLDVATPSYATGSTIVMLGNGDGTLRMDAVTFAAGSNATSIVTADFDQDGLPDVAVSQASGVGVLFNASAH